MASTVRFAPSLTAIVVLCCGEPEQDAALAMQAPPPQAAAPMVQLTGCVESNAWRRTCSVPAGGELVVWIDSPVQPSLEIGGAAATIGRLEPAERGWRALLPADMPLGTLAVRVDGSAPWTVELQRSISAPEVAAVAASLPSYDDPDRESRQRAGLARLELALPDLHGDARVDALHLASQVALALGDSNRAGKLAAEALADALRESGPGHVMQAAHLLHSIAGSGSAARWAKDIEELYAEHSLDDRQRANARYDDALVQIADGDIGAAMASLEECERTARHLDLPQLELASASQRAWILAFLGRSDEQRALLARIFEIAPRVDQLAPCRKIGHLNNVAWSLLVTEARSAPTRSTGELIERLVADAERPGACSRAGGEGAATIFNAHLNFAIEALLRRDSQALRERLAWFTGRSPPATYGAWVAYLRGELALASGKPRAALASLRTVGPTPDDPLLTWQAAVLRGRAAEAVGDKRAALAAYLDAEKQLETVNRAIAIDQGRDGLAAGTHASAAHAIALLLEAGDVRRAMTVARSSRNRALRSLGRASTISSLSAEDRRAWAEAIGEYRALTRQLGDELKHMWSLPEDARRSAEHTHERLRARMRDSHARAFAILERAPVGEPALRPPTPDETWLLYHPAPDGWFAFAVTQAEVEFARLPNSDVIRSGRVDATALLRPFRTAIATASSVRFLLMGELLGAPFHLASWDTPGGERLIDRMPVAWALDVAVAPTSERPRRSLIVANPSTRLPDAGPLPSAGVEGHVARLALGDAGFSVAMLTGDDADSAKVLAALRGTDWFHYAGHGWSGGTEGWDSSLQLASQTRIDVRDILVAGPGPRVAVLSGCHTADSRLAGGAGGMHLAAAFLIAGSTVVVGSRGPLDDQHAAVFSEEFYAAAERAGFADGPRMFRDAARASAARGVNIEELRVWVP